MTDPEPQEVTDTGESSDWSGNFNPKWESALSQVPPEYHAKLAPELANWDRGVQRRFQEIAPWKDVMGSGMTPETVQQAIVLARSIQEDPRGVYDSMAQHYNFQQAVAAHQDAEEQLEEMNPWEPGFKELKGQVEMLGKVILANYEKEQAKAQAQQEDAALDKQMREAAQKYGPAWNEQTALKLIQGFDSVDEAYNFFLQGGRQQASPNPAPRVMGTGSAFPQLGNKNPADLSDNERTGLIAQMIEDIKRA